MKLLTLMSRCSAQLVYGRYDGLLRVGEPLGVGKVLPVVDDVHPVSKLVRQVSGGLAHVSAAHHHQRRRGGEALNEQLGLVINGHRFVRADRSHAAGGFQRDFVQLGGSDTAGYGTVGAQQELGAQGSAVVAFRPDYGSQGGRFRAVVRAQQLGSNVGKVVGFPEGLEVKVHRAAANEAVAGPRMSSFR